jgi:hypothetical protein
MTKVNARDKPQDPSPAERNTALDLMLGERRAGWIAGDRIGFVGFGDHVQAVQGAWIAHRTLMRRIAGDSGAALVPAGPIAFALEPRGAEELILANEEPIALLVRPGASRTAKSYGFEIRVPSDPDELSLRASAYRMSLALRSSGIAWPMTRASAAPAEVTTEQAFTSIGDVATNDTGGTNDVIDHSHQPPRRWLAPRWLSRRRASTRQRDQPRVRRLRQH